MTYSSPLRMLTAVAALILALFVVALFPSSPAAQIRATRIVEYDFIIDPQIVSLAKIQELRPEGHVINAWMEFIPDKTIPRTGEGGRVINILNDIAVRMSRSFESSAEYNGALGIRPQNANDLVDFSGATLRLLVSNRNDPSHEEVVRAQKFTRLDSKSFKLKGEVYTVTRWVKRDNDLRSLLGTATAQLDLKAGAKIGNVTSVFSGNFKRISRKEFDVSGLPTSERGEKLARARFKAFRDELNVKFNMVLETLNEPQPMLSEEERLSLADLPAGTVKEFNRKISYTWYGEKRTVNIVMTATLGGLRYLDDKDEKPIKPFDDK